MGNSGKLVCIGLLVFCLGADLHNNGLSGALARDDGRYAQSPLKQWFNSLKNKLNQPCCDTADGLRLDDIDWETTNGRYRVRIEGQWHDVPDDAVLDQPNKYGPAMVWPTKDAAGRLQIRCFIAGALT